MQSTNFSGHDTELVVQIAKRLKLMQTAMWCASLCVSASLLSFTLRVEWEKDRQLKRDCFASNERIAASGRGLSNFCR